MGTWKCLWISTCYILLGLSVLLKAFALLTVFSHFSKPEQGAGGVYVMRIVIHVPLFSNIPPLMEFQVSSIIREKHGFCNASRRKESGDVRYFIILPHAAVNQRKKFVCHIIKYLRSTRGWMINAFGAYDPNLKER